MKFAFVEAEKANYPIAAICRVLEVSRSGYYRRANGSLSTRARNDAALSQEIASIFEKSRCTYGSPRIFQELKAQGMRISEKRVERLMRESGLQARTRRRFKATTDSRHDHPIAPNLVERQFQVERPNPTWVTDVKAIWTTQDGWVYLAVVLDLFSRRVVG